MEQERLLPHPAGSAKPFFEVNIGGYSIGGPVIIPGVIDSRTSQKKVYFFLSQEFTRGRAADRRQPHEPADRARARAATSRRRSPARPRCNADGQLRSAPQTLQRDHRPADAHAVRGQRDSAEPDQPDRPARSSTCCRCRTTFATDGERVQQLERRARTRRRCTRGQNFVSRVRRRAGARTSGSAARRCSTATTASRTTACSRARPTSNNVFPGDLLTGAMSKVLGPTMVNEVTVGLLAQPLRLPRRQGRGRPVRLHASTTVTSTAWSGGLPRLEDFAPNPGPIGFSRYNKQEWPFMPDFTFAGGNRSNLQPWRPFGGQRASGDDVERELPLHVPGRPVVDEGPAQLQVRLLHRARQQDRARLGRLRGRVQLRPQRGQPAQHRQRLRQRAARRRSRATPSSTTASTATNAALAE